MPSELETLSRNLGRFSPPNLVEHSIQYPCLHMVRRPSLHERITGKARFLTAPHLYAERFAIMYRQPLTVLDVRFRLVWQFDILESALQRFAGQDEVLAEVCRHMKTRSQEYIIFKIDRVSLTASRGRDTSCRDKLSDGRDIHEDLHQKAHAKLSMRDNDTIQPCFGYSINRNQSIEISSLTTFRGYR